MANPPLMLGLPGIEEMPSSDAELARPLQFMQSNRLPVASLPVTSGAVNPINYRPQIAINQKRISNWGAAQRKSSLVKRLFTTGDFADLAIVCGSVSFAVHKAIVCPQSQFFRAAVTSGFAESISNTITLHEERPERIAKLLEYFYTGEVIFPGRSAPQSNNENNHDGFLEPFVIRPVMAKDECVVVYPLLLDLIVLGDRYIVDGLKDYAITELFAALPGAIENAQVVANALKFLASNLPKGTEDEIFIALADWCLLHKAEVVKINKSGISIGDEVVRVGMPFIKTEEFRALAGECPKVALVFMDRALVVGKQTAESLLPCCRSTKKR